MASFPSFHPCRARVRGRTVGARARPPVAALPCGSEAPLWLKELSAPGGCNSSTACGARERHMVRDGDPVEARRHDNGESEFESI